MSRRSLGEGGSAFPVSSPSALRLLTNNQEQITAPFYGAANLTKLFQAPYRNSLSSQSDLSTTTPAVLQRHHKSNNQQPLTSNRVATQMTTKADPYATKTQKRVDALLIVFTVLFILFALRISARGETILSVAPQPFWSTLNLFKTEPKLSMVLVAPSFLTQGQPDYRAANGPDFAALAGLSGNTKGSFSPTMLMPETARSQGAASVNLDAGNARRSFTSSDPSLADNWSRGAGVGSTIPAYSTGFGAPSSNLAGEPTNSSQNAPRHAGESSGSLAIRKSNEVAPAYNGGGSISSAPTSTFQHSLSSRAVPDPIPRYPPQRLALLKLVSIQNAANSTLSGKPDAPRAVTAVLAGWDVTPLTGGTGNYGPSPFTATTTAANVTIGGLTRGVGFATTGFAATSAWGGVVNTASSSQATAIANGQFATLSLTSSARVHPVALKHWCLQHPSVGLRGDDRHMAVPDWCRKFL